MDEETIVGAAALTGSICGFIYSWQKSRLKREIMKEGMKFVGGEAAVMGTICQVAVESAKFQAEISQAVAGMYSDLMSEALELQRNVFEFSEEASDKAALVVENLFDLTETMYEAEIDLVKSALSAVFEQVGPLSDTYWQFVEANIQIRSQACRLVLKTAVELTKLGTAGYTEFFKFYIGTYATTVTGVLSVTEDVREKVLLFAQSLYGSIAGISAESVEMATEIANSLISLIQTLTNVYVSFVTAITNTMKSVASAILGLPKDVVEKVVMGGIQIMNNVIGQSLGRFADIINLLEPVVGQVTGVLSELQGFTSTIGSLSDNMETLKNIFNSAKSATDFLQNFNF